MPKNDLIKSRITKILHDKQLTTREIKDKLYSYKTTKGRRSTKGMPTTNQLQMILRVHYRKVGYCERTNQTVWGNRLSI